MPARSKESRRVGIPPVCTRSPPWRTNTGSVSTMSFSTRPGTATISLTRRTPALSMPRWTTRSTELATVGYDEPGRDVLARQQRQGAQLHQRLARAVGVERRHARQPGVERQQQVEALGRPDLADDDPGRPHPQRLAHEVAQRRPRRSPRARPAASASATQSGWEKRSSKTSSAEMIRSPPGIAAARQFSIVVLPACVPPATTMFWPASTAASRNRAAPVGSEPEPHQVVEPRGLEHELADVDRRELAADPLEHDVQPVALRAASRRRTAATGRSDGRWTSASARPAPAPRPWLRITLVSSWRPLRATKTRLGSLIQISSTSGSSRNALERAEAGDPGDQLADHAERVGHRRDDAGQAALVVGADDLLGDAAHAGHVELRVDPFAAYDGTHLLVEVTDEIDRRSSRDIHRHGAVSTPDLRNRKPASFQPVDNLATPIPGVHTGPSSGRRATEGRVQDPLPAGGIDAADRSCSLRFRACRCAVAESVITRSCSGIPSRRPFFWM